VLKMSQHTRRQITEMGKGRRGNCSSTELLPHLAGQNGVEPMTDNPISSAHLTESGQEAIVDVLLLCQLSYFR